MSGYTDTIRKWAVDLRRSGQLDDPDGIGEVGLGADEAGRRLAVRFTLKLAGDRVDDIRFQVFGCGFTVAACAVAAELAIKQPLAAVGMIDAGRIDAALRGLPVERSYCAELAAEALQAAVAGSVNGAGTVQAVHAPAEHGPRLTRHDPVLQLLLTSYGRRALDAADRELFAGVIAVAVREPWPLEAALGLDTAQLRQLLDVFFPEVGLERLQRFASRSGQPFPEVNDAVLSVICGYLSAAALKSEPPVALWLAKILTARAALPGHLWVAMGFFERPQLSAAIRRHLPALAAANDRNMRWKRFLFKQVCDLNGGTLCKAPNCGVCSDYALCFDAGDAPAGGD